MTNTPRKRAATVKRPTRGRPARDSSSALTREKIVRAALQIVDREGLPALSMRRLGAGLGVDPMAIYYHLPNKAALYDAIVEAVMAEVDLDSGPGLAAAQTDGPGGGPPGVSAETPRAESAGAGPVASAGTPLDQLRNMARSYRDALMAHPNAMPVVAARPVRTPASLRPIERMLAVIASMGFSAQESIAMVDVCGHYIIGWAQTYAAHLNGSEIHDHGPVDVAALPEEEFPNLLRVLKAAPNGNPFAVEFELGIDALLRGFVGAARGRS